MTDPLTPETLAELRRLLGEANPQLPWAVDPDDRPGMDYNNHIVVAASPHLRVCFMCHDGPAKQDEWDAKAALIVAAVNALPALLTIAEAYQRTIERDAHMDCYQYGNVPPQWVEARRKAAAILRGYRVGDGIEPIIKATALLEEGDKT